MRRLTFVQSLTIDDRPEFIIRFTTPMRQINMTRHAIVYNKMSIKAFNYCKQIFIKRLFQ